MTQDVRLHAMLSPSGADRWMTCLGSVALTKDLPDTENAYSIEGTDYHELAALCLEEETDAHDYIGRPMPSGAIVTEENARYLQDGYLDPVRAYAALGSLLVEERVPIHHLTGESNAEGTADAVIIPEADELIVVDLKFGRGVDVEVEDNRQLKMYALGVLEKHGLAESVKQVRLVICQPRIGEGKPKEWVISVDDLVAFGNAVKLVAAKIRAQIGLPLVPSEKACQFCKAKPTCPALVQVVQNAMTEGFTDLGNPTDQVMLQAQAINPEEPNVSLSDSMKMTNLVEIWLKAVRAAVEIELLAGREVRGYRLAMGKKGNRQWSDEAEVEKIMKDRWRYTYDQMYDLTLKSPTTMEKALKKNHTIRWNSLAEFITQKTGVPSVVPESDKRPPYIVPKAEEGFEKVDTGADLI